jgi:hypothetical protein
MLADDCQVAHSLMAPMGQAEVEQGQAAADSSGGVVVEVGNPAVKVAVVAEAVLNCVVVARRWREADRPW